MAQFVALDNQSKLSLEYKSKSTVSNITEIFVGCNYKFNNYNQLYGVALRRGFHKIYFKHKFRLGGIERDINFCKRQVKMAILGYTLPADNIQKLTAKKTRTNLN